MFGAASYSTPSGSMMPTLQPGDTFVVDAWRYRNASPAFGDIVVCELDEGTLVIKRVVGVPGDTLELRGPRLVRNGNLVDEPYLNLDDAQSLPSSPPLTLGANEFFVLGDYRGNSNDSRQRGPLGRERIFGRVEFIAYGRSGDRFSVVLASD
jgi:signal peptidase I